MLHPSNFMLKFLISLFFGIHLLNCVTCLALLPTKLQNAAQQGLLIEEPIPNLYLLGTVHIGSQSAEEAKMLIEAVKPKKAIIEIPPSRLPRIRSKIKSGRRSSHPVPSQSERPQASTFLGAISMYPSLAIAGWSTGGLSGFLFSTAIVWPSLLKRSITGNEEEKDLPRVNEFEIAVEAGDCMNTEIIAADLEFDELIQSVVKSMTIISWFQLGGRLSAEAIGLLPTDPVRRQRGETLIEWEMRRRNISTARSSRNHGENIAPEIHNVLVCRRDQKFAELCLDAIKTDGATVCICGLVHIDGILDILKDEYPNINLVKA